ncbi:MAG: SDR family NAD(P)-dependent oxidoreductase [Pseudomonadales bacterium]|nr:SDR family NAD(P)-dependent oxidoreductase [Pseudomonadales bacterium]
MAAVEPQQKFDGKTSAEQVVAGRDLSAQTIIVTGANTGIGEAAAVALAGAGARVVFACRSADTGKAAVVRAKTAYPNCRAEFTELDLASFASIKRFAAVLDAEGIDTLVCNAGLAALDYEETEDGFERTTGVCHIGHFLLTRLLMPKLLAAPAPRVIMVSSTSHKQPPKLDFTNFPMSRDRFKGLAAYGQAKLCNVLMAKSLQRRYGEHGLTACALHPGTLISTDIGRNSAIMDTLIKLISPFTKSRSQGAATTVWAAVHEPAAELAGQYLKDCRIARSSAESNDVVVAERLWDATERLLAGAGPVPDWP